MCVRGHRGVGNCSSGGNIKQDKRSENTQRTKAEGKASRGAATNMKRRGGKARAKGICLPGGRGPTKERGASNNARNNVTKIVSTSSIRKNDVETSKNNKRGRSVGLLEKGKGGFMYVYICIKYDK